METPICPGCHQEMEHVLLDEFEYFYCACADDGCDICPNVGYDYDGNVIYKFEDLVEDDPVFRYIHRSE